MNTVKSLKSTIHRKILTSILTISLVLGSISFALAAPATADDLSVALGAGWGTNSNGLTAPYGKDMSSSWYYLFGHNTMNYLRDIRYQLTGTDYDNHSGNSIFTYINNIYTTLTDASTGSILYGINQQNTKLSDIYNSIGVGGAGNNVLTKLSSLINGQTDVNQNLNTIINNGIDVTLSQTVEDSITNIESVLSTPLFNPYNYVRRGDVYSTGNFQTINNNKYYPVVTMNNPDGRLSWDSVTINSNIDFLSAIYNGVLGVNNRLATMGTAYKSTVYTTSGAISQNSLYSIQDSLVVYGDNNSEQNNTIIEQLKSIDSDYNDINWIQKGTINWIRENLTTSNITGVANVQQFYVNFVPDSYNNGGIYKLYLPISFNNVRRSDYSFELGYIYNDTFYGINDYVIAINSSVTHTEFIVQIPIEYANILSNSFVLHGSMTGTTYFRISGTLSKSMYYMDFDKKDFYDISDWAMLYNILDLFREAKEMFFDDESLQAKKNNAGQTTAVLTGFTGGGQASATANDYGTLSTGVSDVKGGMNTNVSANNAFGIFNNSNGYSFWSVDTLQELNQSGTNTRFNSKSANDDGYEYYNNRLEYLLNAMTGGDKK